MYRNRLGSASLALALGLWASSSFAQTGGIMTFDGGADGTSWNQANNWNETAQPDGTPVNGNPATPPTSGHTANIGGNFTVLLSGAMAAQDTFRTRVGVTTTGTLNMTGGSLHAGDDVTVGQSAKGIMTIGGGTVSNGDDFFVDVADFSSVLTLNDGLIEVGDKMQMANHGQFIMNGGHLIGHNDLIWGGLSTATIGGGLIENFDKLSLGGAAPLLPARLIINAGTVRVNEWTDNPDLGADDLTRFMSTIQINGSGKLQVEADHFSVTLAQNLISDGRLTTAGSGSLVVTSVVIPVFFGRENVGFTQIAAVPEPASIVLVMAGAALAFRRRK